MTRLGIPGNKVKNNQMENPQATPVSISEESELEDDEILPLSGKPHFTVIFSTSHVKGQLNIPVKISRDLPPTDVPAILTCCGKNWDVNVIYLGIHTKFDYPTFRTFVQDNELEVGDACVFELMESSSVIIRFRVQILRGTFPPELEERINGETSNTPIVLD